MNNVYIKWEYISRIVLQVAYFSHNCRIPMTNTALSVFTSRYLYKLYLIQIFAQPFYMYY